jgi:phosphatidate cytidylyltransferase
MNLTPSKSFLTRLGSALILAPVSGFMILKGGWWMAALMAAFAIVTIWEWIGLTRTIPHKMLWRVGGFLYFIAAFRAYALTSAFPHGGLLCFALIASVWGSDILAYVFGKTWSKTGALKYGKGAMCPWISPNKTWVGLIGAYLGAIAIFALFDLTELKTQFSGIESVFVGALIATVGQLGDLLISTVKRLSNTKDTGTIIPGHGGVLDRIDSLIMAALIFYVYMCIFHA